MDYDDNPVPQVPLKISIGNGNINIRPYITSSQNVNLLDTYTTFYSDSNGQIILTFKIAENIGPLNITFVNNDAKYESLITNITVYRIDAFDYSFAKASLTIINKKLLYDANEEFALKIEHYGHLNTNLFYVFLIKQHSIVDWFQIESKSGQSIKLTNKMAPSIRILVLGFTKDTNQLVADSCIILIKQNNCGVHLSIETPADEIRPGNKLTLKMNGTKNDVMALSAIDLSVQLIADRRKSSKVAYREKFFQNFLSKAHLFSSIKVNDSISLIERFGLQVISADDNQKSEINWRRNRRSLETECDSYKNNVCCQLARSKLKKKLTCEKRRKILENRIKNRRCVAIFYRCCKCSALSMLLPGGSMQFSLFSATGTIGIYHLKINLFIING